MNRILVIGPAEKRKIAEVMIFARENRVPLEKLKEANAQMLAGYSPRAVGDDVRFRCELPIGYRVVYSEEQHPGGLMRHLSVSVDTPGRAPNTPAMEILMTEFGFRNPSPSHAEILTFMEEFPGVTAINVMEKMEASGG